VRWTPYLLNGYQGILSVRGENWQKSKRVKDSLRESLANHTGVSGDL